MSLPVAPDTFHVFDTTLRDGAQQEGLRLTVADKLKIARHLDELGVDFIEGGWPGSNPKDIAFFEAAARQTWQHAKLAAFRRQVVVDLEARHRRRQDRRRRISES